jgi:hypothetical protein
MKNIETNLDLENNFKFAAALIKVIAVVIALMVLAVSKYSFIFFAAAMLPTLIAVCLDRNKHKCASATICTFNLIGALPYLMRLWDGQSINYIAKLIIIDIDTWLVIYGAAFVGQLLYMSAPLLIVKLYSVKTQIYINKLEKRCDELSEEWGIALSEEEEDNAQNSNQKQ